MHVMFTLKYSSNVAVQNVYNAKKCWETISN